MSVVTELINDYSIPSYNLIRIEHNITNALTHNT